jgi:hypothetical protein
MKKRTTKNLQPDQKMNSEQQTIDTTSRQAIANTHVMGSLFRHDINNYCQNYSCPENKIDLQSPSNAIPI